MERSGPAFFESEEDDEDDENDFSIAEVRPKEEDEPSVIDKLKKIMGIEEESGSEKQGILERLSEDTPEVEKPDKTESTFPLSMLGGPEKDSLPDSETLVEPHREKPTVIDPELLAEDEPEEPERLTIRQQPLQQQATKEVVESEPELETEVDVAEEPPEPPASPPPPTTAATPVASARIIESETPATGVETDDFATHREASRKALLAGAAGVGAAIVANSRAKKRESKIEHRSEKRDQEMNKKVEKHHRTTSAEQARLRREMEAVKYAEKANDHQTTTDEVQQRVEQALGHDMDRPGKVEAPLQAEIPPETGEAPSPEPVEETYSPDVHDRIPPHIAFEQLTGIEQPLPRTLEQERRHEVKDDPSKTPVSYTQPDLDSPWNHPVSNSPQSARSTLVGLGAAPTIPPNHQLPARTPNQTYKKAIISGAIMAAVVLVGFMIFMLVT